MEKIVYVLLLYLIFSLFLLVIGAGLLCVACRLVGVGKPPFPRALSAMASVMFIALPTGLIVATIINEWWDLRSNLSPILGLRSRYGGIAAILGVAFILSVFFYAWKLADFSLGKGVLILLAQTMLVAMIGGVVYAVVFITRFALGEQSLFEMIGLG